MSKQQKKLIGTVAGFVLVILFCLTTKSFQGVNADGYPLINTFDNVQVGNAEYQLVNQEYNKKTDYLEMQFLRTSEYAEVNKPEIKAEFVSHTGQSSKTNVQLVTNDFVVVQVKEINDKFELGKIVIKEKTHDATSRKDVNAESDGIYFSTNSLVVDNEARPLTKEEYMTENIKIRIALLDKKITKLEKTNDRLKSTNKKSKVYMKELENEKELLIGTDKEKTNEKIQSVQTEYEATQLEIKENEESINAYTKQKSNYKKQL
ncbi:TPA: hypothetical protein ACSK7M_002465 [Listeria innocua]|nr:hypothetical protein [Listeria innocua]EIA8104334.1 hypothetical protein [Listeria monocytogenes]EKF9258968.1 hypothetical protein [Listeria monocytogenes]EKZ0354285.1 hypothetical protein [Listeria monocytogenes]